MIKLIGSHKKKLESTRLVRRTQMTPQLGICHIGSKLSKHGQEVIYFPFYM